MTRRYGWGPTSARVKGAVPHGHWKVTTFVAALRASGLTAPMTVDGALNGELFRAYVEREDTPRPLLFQLDLLRHVGFAQVEVLHQNVCFAAFGAVKG